MGWGSRCPASPLALPSVIFNFLLNDKRKSPIWNVIMWTCLFIGQGIQVCLYCQEWYAQIHCPLEQVRAPGPEAGLGHRGQISPGCRARHPRPRHGSLISLEY